MCPKALKRLLHVEDAGGGTRTENKKCRRRKKAVTRVEMVDDETEEARRRANGREHNFALVNGDNLIKRRKRSDRDNLTPFHNCA